MTTPGVTTIERFNRLEARLVEYEWIWARHNRERIAAHWDARRARTPALFNGRILMVAEARLSPDRLQLDFFATDYADMLAHIDWGFPDPSVQNGFAMGALRSRDGAFVLATMADGTANAGRVYFPAGTPDISDVRADGTVDLAGSILREIAEETGLEVDAEAFGPGWSLVRQGGRSAVMRGVRLDRDADDLAAAIRAHIRADPKAELADVMILRGPGEIDAARMPAFLPDYLRFAFAE